VLKQPGEGVGRPPSTKKNKSGILEGKTLTAMGYRENPKPITFIVEDDVVLSGTGAVFVLKPWSCFSFQSLTLIFGNTRCSENQISVYFGALLRLPKGFFSLFCLD
jgi:hypothetical protein